LDTQEPKKPDFDTKKSPLRNIRRRSAFIGGFIVSLYELGILVLAANEIAHGNSSAYSKIWVISALIFPLTATFLIAYYIGKIASSARLLVGVCLQLVAAIALSITHMLTTSAGVDLMVYLGIRVKGKIPKGQWHQFNFIANTRDAIDLIPPFLVVALIAFLVIRLRMRSDLKFNAGLAVINPISLEPGLPNPSLNSDPAARG
jgi:hypothetical protein